MEVTLIILGCLLAVGIPLYLHDRRYRRKKELEGKQESFAVEPQEECCGMHVNCEKTSLVATAGPAVYYEDEELDSFIGREPESYTGEETEQFRDILLTLLPQDVAGWSRSLQQRGINLPPDVRDELLLIVEEQRAIEGESKTA